MSASLFKRIAHDKQVATLASIPRLQVGGYSAASGEADGTN